MLMVEVGVLVGSCVGQIASRTSSDVFISNLELHFEGFRVLREAQIVCKGIEDINLEHCPKSVTSAGGGAWEATRAKTGPIWIPA